MLRFEILTVNPVLQYDVIMSSKLQVIFHTPLELLWEAPK